MGLLTKIFKSRKQGLVHLPTGSFTLDRAGKLITSTLPRSFPEEQLREIGQHVLEAFRAARKADMELTEIIVHYAALKLLAREQRGGAIVFLSPHSLAPAMKKSY
jgi:hypothetical protein